RTSPVQTYLARRLDLQELRRRQSARHRRHKQLECRSVANIRAAAVNNFRPHLQLAPLLRVVRDLPAKLPPCPNAEGTAAVNNFRPHHQPARLLREVRDLPAKRQPCQNGEGTGTVRSSTL